MKRIQILIATVVLATGVTTAFAFKAKNDSKHRFFNTITAIYNQSGVQVLTAPSGNSNWFDGAETGSSVVSIVAGSNTLDLYADNGHSNRAYYKP